MKPSLGLVVGAGTAVALAVAGPVARAQSSDLAPTGAWELQQTAESCSLVRNFADNARKLQLRIQSFGQATPFHIILTGDGLPRREQKSAAVEVGFGGPETAQTTLGLIGKADGKPMVVLASDARNFLGWLYVGTQIDFGLSVDPAAETLYVETVDMDPALFQLGPMEGEFARLQECASAIEDKWADAAAGDGRPVGEPRLLTPKEANWRTKYPENLLLNRISGLVEIRMTVDERGRASDCVVQSSVWASRFGEASCTNLERWGRFEPAKDATGKPVRAQYRTAGIYVIYNW